MVSSSAISELDQPKIIRLTPDYPIKPFNCTNKDLNEFLFKDSFFNLKYLKLVTYLLEIPDKTIAYYSLANDILKISASSSREFKALLRSKIKNTEKYDLFTFNEFPAVKIGRFAVDQDFQRNGIGTQLIQAIKYLFLENNKTGCTFITVDAINEKKSIDFYKKNGFTFLTDNDRTKDSRLMYDCLIKYINYQTVREI